MLFTKSSLVIPCGGGTALEVRRLCALKFKNILIQGARSISIYRLRFYGLL